MTAMVYRIIMNKIERLHRGQNGLSTAELLGNAALAIVALLAIWALLQALGTDIVGWIRGQLSAQLQR